MYRKPRRSPTQSCALVFAAFFGLVVLVGIVSPSKTPSKTPTSGRAPQSVNLNVEVRATITELLVTNKDRFDWTNARIRVNLGVASTFSTGYELTVRRIAAGETLAIPLIKFTNSAGARFSPLATAVKMVVIEANTPHGRGFVAKGK